MSISLKPSDASGGEPQPLDTTKKREVSKLRDLSLDEITSSFISPPNDDAYFVFRNPPSTWFEASKDYSKPHLFIKAFSLVSTDKRLQEYGSLRKAISVSGGDINLPDTVSGLVATFLNDRPLFHITRMSRFKKFLNWNAWDKSILRGFHSHASDDYGITATTLWLVYSVKAMLTSERQSMYVTSLSKRVVSEWDRWLEYEVDEMGKFQKILATITHQYTNTNV